jgi:tRNA 2-selenouridine synthase
VTTVVDSAGARCLPAGRASDASEIERFPIRNLVVLSGRAGVGKTDVLRALGCQGAQVIDLEALACHRGSAFGALGQPAQPSHTEFHARIATAWRAARPELPLFVEDEGDYLGSVGVPRSVLVRMRDADRVMLETPRPARVSRLLRDYGAFQVRDLAAAVRRAAPRLSSHSATTALHALARGEREEAVSALLPFYDRAYAHRLARNGSTPCLIRVDGTDADRAAAAILACIAETLTVVV